MSKRQGHAVGFEKNTRTNNTAKFTELYHAVQKPDYFDGFTKNYDPIDENGERLPAESKKVQMRVSDTLAEAGNLIVSSIDAAATKDYGNVLTSGDVVVDGVVLVKGASTPFLLFLEKRIIDFKTFVEAAPTLDPNFDWWRDENSGLYKTAVVEKHRTKKVQEPIVKYPATQQHPAQTDLISKDVLAGYWKEQKLSGALPQVEKKRLIANAQKLLSAVEGAIHEANSITVEEKFFGRGIADFLTK